jgi:hypothetical protein
MKAGIQWASAVDAADDTGDGNSGWCGVAWTKADDI